MADWELFGGLISAVTALVTWAPWYGDIFRVNKLAAPRSYRLVLALTPVACLLFVWLCLEKAAAKAVRDNSLYILIYMALGAAMLGISAHLYSFMGISARDDVLERRGAAAVAAIVGALVGTTLCFAGGNTGEGPGIEVVLLCAGSAICIWFLLWYLAEFLSAYRLSERITVERDLSSGLRLAGLLVANGAILGAAVAGDWTADLFLRDLLSAWPALVITALAVFVERISDSRFAIGRSILVAVTYLAIAAAWVRHAVRP